MHEVSLVQSLLQTVLESAAKHGITSVHTVKLVVGELHGALPDALQFAFEVLTEETVCAGATLIVAKKPLVLRCNPCDQEFRPDHISWCCPGCNNYSHTIVSGRELFVEYYEGD